eukprot:GFYU01018657.1.p1 GENE.GFYU01018657.1~~GFYU01018657.1.p1  ORF type:complete len:358 (+),score=94.66 GFYU01018657.1:58-1074(+)
MKLSLVFIAAAFVAVLAVTPAAASDNTITLTNVNADSNTFGSTPPSFDNSYIAAVVEYSPSVFPVNATFDRDDAVALLKENLGAYAKYVESAKAQGAQIIVFPEYGLMGWPSDSWTRETMRMFIETIPEEGSNPCNDHSGSDEHMVSAAISCLAQQYKIVVVFDHGDRQPCPGRYAQYDPKCDADGEFMFNTAVAFDEEGTILSKYHKHHLYFEGKWYDVEPKEAWTKAFFTTSFGVRFGMFICFDLIWATETETTDYVFPTWWDNIITPAEHAVPAQTLWSTLHKVNLLAANIGISFQCSGSGIYHQGTPLATVFNPFDVPQSKMLIARVPKVDKST